MAAVGIWTSGLIPCRGASPHRVRELKAAAGFAYKSWIIWEPQMRIPAGLPGDTACLTLPFLLRGRGCGGIRTECDLVLLSAWRDLGLTALGAGGGRRL